MLLSKLEKVPADIQSMIEVNKKMKIDRSIFADEEREGPLKAVVFPQEFHEVKEFFRQYMRP